MGTKAPNPAPDGSRPPASPAPPPGTLEGNPDGPGVFIGNNDVIRFNAVLLERDALRAEVEQLRAELEQARAERDAARAELAIADERKAAAWYSGLDKGRAELEQARDAARAEFRRRFELAAASVVESMHARDVDAGKPDQWLVTLDYRDLAGIFRGLADMTFGGRRP